jgi:hypothetical protein
MHASEKSAEVLTTTHRQPFPEAATSREGLSQNGPPLKHPGMEEKILYQSRLLFEAYLFLVAPNLLKIWAEHCMRKRSEVQYWSAGNSRRRFRLRCARLLSCPRQPSTSPGRSRSETRC